MKRAIAIVPLLVMIAVQGVFAASNYPLGIGPSLMFKAGINAASIPEGTKTGMTFNGLPDIGASLYIPVSKSSMVGTVVDLSYSTYSYGIRGVVGDQESDLYRAQASYLLLSPSLYFSSFIIGLDFGLPMSGTMETPLGDATIKTENMSTLVEVHLGGMIPIVENKDGRLNVLLRGGYMLTGLDKDDDSEFNPKVASFGIGFNYYFNLR